MFGLVGILVGIILILIGGFMVFLFPGTAEHQPDEFGIAGIVIGLILIIIGGVLIFVA